MCPVDKNAAPKPLTVHTGGRRIKQNPSCSCHTLIDKDGRHIETTNRTKLPIFEKLKKSEVLGYDLFDKDMILTNPTAIST